MLTMDHTEATNTGAAERYALGEMDEPERDQYEQHYFTCPECGEEVKAAVRFLDAAKPIVRETEQARVPDVSARPRAAEVTRPGWGFKTLFWPMPLATAAAFVLVLGGPAVYLAAVKVPQLERSLADAESLQAAPWSFLSVSRSEPTTVRVSKGTRMIGVTLSRSFTTTFPHYRCELRDAAGHAILSAILPAPSAGDELQLLVPASQLRPGSYELVLFGSETPSGPTNAPELARYAFKLEHEEKP